MTLKTSLKCRNIVSKIGSIFKISDITQPYLFGAAETTSVLPRVPNSGLVCMHLLSNTASSVGQPLDTETIAQILWSQTHESVSPKSRHDVKVNLQLDEGVQPRNGQHGL